MELRLTEDELNELILLCATSACPNPWLTNSLLAKAQAARAGVAWGRDPIADAAMRPPIEPLLWWMERGPLAALQEAEAAELKREE